MKCSLNMAGLRGWQKDIFVLFKNIKATRFLLSILFVCEIVGNLRPCCGNL